LGGGIASSQISGLRPAFYELLRLPDTGQYPPRCLERNPQMTRRLLARAACRSFKRKAQSSFEMDVAEIQSI
jgi:hypothetical protein